MPRLLRTPAFYYGAGILLAVTLLALIFSLKLWTTHHWLAVVIRLVAILAALTIASVLPWCVSRVIAITKALRDCGERGRRMQAHAAVLVAINDLLEREAAERGLTATALLKAHNQALMQSEVRNQTFEETTPVGIFHTDVAGRIRAVNNAWCGITGLRSAQSLNDGWQAKAHPEDLQRIRKAWLDGRGKKAPFSSEFRFLPEDGRIKWVNWKTQAEFNSLGKIIGYVGTVTDITERKAAEESVKTSAAETRSVNDELSFYKFAIDQAAIVAVTDSAGTISYVNDKFCEISGYQREELIGQNHRLLNSRYHPKSFFTEMYGNIARGNVWRGEIRNRAKDGHHYWVDTTIVPTQDADGRVTRYVAIRADITERKNTEAALGTQRIALEHANLALADKNEQLSELYQTAQRFMDDVSHEFRTPLSVIKGYSEIMRAGIAGPQSPDQIRFNQVIIDRTRDMAQMIDDLLDSSKLRSGSLRVDRKSCAVVSIFAALHPIIDSRVVANKIEWIEEIQPGLPRIFADAEKATRVLVNLVVNAIKFSPPGSRVVLAAKLGENGDVLISLTDQGPGISPENMVLIFERFRQVGNAVDSTKGFGLGLNIAKELVSLNLGQMSVSSTLQKGSTFSFTLPPDNPEIVIDRLFKQLEKLGTPPGTFAVLRVTPQNATSRGGTPAELHGFLACSSDPRDVIMPTHDGTAWILFGYSAKPGVWHQRLAKAGREIEQFSPSQKLCAFEVELVDTLPYPAALPDAIAMVLKYLAPESVHV